MTAFSEEDQVAVTDIVGQGKYSYRLVKDWAKLPKGETLGLVSSGACDSADRVYICQRKDPPILVFDQNGNLIESWGTGVFERPHGLSITDDVLHVADDGGDEIDDGGGHACYLYDLDGGLILTLGRNGFPSDTGYTTEHTARYEPVPRSAGPFNRPTKLVSSEDGDLFVSDGYGNARIHRFSPEGELKNSWGQPGSHPGVVTSPGEFNIVHSVVVHAGRVYVVDRENLRVQIFTLDGEHLDTWLVPRPLDIVVDQDGILYLSGRVQGESLSLIRVMDLDGNSLAEFESRGGHNIWLDSQGSIYAGLGRHHQASIRDEDRQRDPNYVPPTSYGGGNIVGGVDKFVRI